MSNRLIYAVFCIATLSLGGLLYVLFRENTYIAVLFDGSELFEKIRDMTQHIVNDFFKFYFPDYLWGLSLCFGLLLVFDPQVLGEIICCSVSFCYGVMWECMQLFGVLNGTGDAIDVICYLAASVTAVIICSIRRGQNEKIY